MLRWEQEFLGLDLVESQFPGAGVGLATSATSTIQKGILLAQYIGHYFLLTQLQTDELFTPIFFNNHERLIQLGPIMKPIVYPHHTSPLEFKEVSLVLSIQHVLLKNTYTVLYLHL